MRQGEELGAAGCAGGLWEAGAGHNLHHSHGIMASLLSNFLGDLIIERESVLFQVPIASVVLVGSGTLAANSHMIMCILGGH